MDKKKQINIIEAYLKNYKTYEVGMKNLQETLDEILPVIKAKNQEELLPDRITGFRAIYLLEQINAYKTILNSIDEAINTLDLNARNFIKYRYFEGWSVEKTAEQLGCSTQNCFKIRTQIMEKLIISLRNITKLPLEF